MLLKMTMIGEPDERFEREFGLVVASHNGTDLSFKGNKISIKFENELDARGLATRLMAARGGRIKGVTLG